MTAALITRGVDDLLGAADNRYFGSGYRRVRHAIHDVVIDPAESSVTGVAELIYPADWSAKAATRTMKPHLSSVDALILGALLVEADLVHRFGLGEAQRRRAWLRSAHIRAGTVPEEDLGAVALAAHATGTGPGELRSARTGYDVRVGPMKVRYQVEHDHPGVATDAGTRLADIGDLLGPIDSLQSGHGYRQRRHSFDRLEIDVAAGHVATRVAIAPTGEAPADRGLEGQYQPAVTLADGIIVTAQLAQIFLYELDQLSRERSNTLWLRQIHLVGPTPYQPVRTPFGAHVRIRKTALTTLRGTTYRVSDASYAVRGITGTYSVAHALPDGHPATAWTGPVRPDEDS